MKQIMIVCCFLSLFVSSIGIAAHEHDPCKYHADSCPDWRANCEGVNCTREKHMETHDMQHVILASLYGMSKEVAAQNIKHDYNYYGESCNYPYMDSKNKKRCVYVGGHAGWDVRTLWENDSNLEKHDFFCITPGIVLADGKLENGGPPECGKVKKTTHNNAIVIYDVNTGYAIHYLHASEVDYENVRKGEYVPFGKRLGKQGNCGNSNGEHIHIEVRRISYLGPAIPYKDLTAGLINHLVEASHGTKDEKRETKDPIPYLYETVIANLDRTGTGGGGLAFTLPEIWARCKMIHEDY